jgi:aspartyl-tRNA(Asn)/glutamyl-tRNA(Gln) amidotransferase subunit C
MKLSQEEVKRIAVLARLGISEDEIEKFRLQLSNILENFEILKQVDTSNLLPTTQSVKLQNVFRTDEDRESYPAEEILANAPQQDNNYFKVKAVLEE